MICYFSEASTPYNHEKNNVFSIRSKNLFLSKKDLINVFNSLDRASIFEKNFQSHALVGIKNISLIFFCSDCFNSI